MPSQIALGTQSATLDTEHELHAETNAEVLVLAVNMTNLANGDVVVLRIYTKLEAADAEELAYEVPHAHAQHAAMKYSVPVPSLASWRATLEQTDGTGRDFKWQVIAL